jgi:uncharacterized protein (TIRG00374 family)
MKNRYFKRLIWILIFVVLLYTGFIVWSGVRENLVTLRDFQWHWMPAILGSVMINFIVRELKWDFFRRAAGIRVPRFGSFLVFFSGYSMAISPARAGELIKPFMYHEYFGQKMRRSVPLVFCERVSDLLGMILLAAITLTSYMIAVSARLHSSAGYVGLLYGFLLFSTVFMLFMIWFIRQKRFVYGLLLKLGRSERLGFICHRARKLYYSTYPLLTIRNLLISSLVAVFSWFWECVAILLIIRGVGAAEVTLAQATFVFCMSTIFGGFLFFLPGGIGGFEASCAVMLQLLGVDKARAVSSIFITRFSTLFFAVALGFLFILITSAKYHKRLMWEELEHAEAETELET